MPQSDSGLTKDRISFDPGIGFRGHAVLGNPFPGARTAKSTRPTGVLNDMCASLGWDRQGAATLGIVGDDTLFP